MNRHLTRRQEEFLRNMIDLYRQVREPAHYSVLAERLGVSRFTAYDMLRLLEEKGLVVSTYQMPEERIGPGRAEVLFQPTAKAQRLFDHLVGDLDPEDWEAVKARLRQRAQGGELDPTLVEGLLARVPPDEPEVIRYCTEVMLVTTLRLQANAEFALLTSYFQRIIPGKAGNCRPNLSLLGGFVLGLLAGRAPRESLWEEELFGHVVRYQELIVDMEPALCHRLANSLRMALTPLLNAE